VNRRGNIWKEFVGKYQDALGVLTLSEESQVLEEEGYRDVGVK